MSLLFATPWPASAQDESAAATTPVRVVGTPEGATIHVDGELWGTVPHEGNVAPGTRFFVLRSEGHTTEARDIDVALSGETLELRFDLVSNIQTGPKIPMIVGGSVVTLGGVAAIVLAIVGGVGDRRCSARCDEEGSRHVVERPAVDAIVAWSVTGVIALVVGPILIGFGATPSTPPRAGSISLRPDGLSLHF